MSFKKVRNIDECDLSLEFKSYEYCISLEEIQSFEEKNNKDVESGL